MRVRVKMSIQEIRRLFSYLFLWRPSIEFILEWIQWRMHHQILAQFYHYKKRHPYAL